MCVLSMDIRNKNGFTLTELLVAMAVLSVLFSITIVTYPGYIERAHDADRKDAISQLNSAIRQYYVFEGDYPPPTQTSGFVADEVTGNTILQGRDRTSEGIDSFLQPVKGGNFIRGNPEDL